MTGGGDHLEGLSLEPRTRVRPFRFTTPLDTPEGAKLFREFIPAPA